MSMGKTHPWTSLPYSQLLIIFKGNSIDFMKIVGTQAPPFDLAGRGEVLNNP